MTTAIPVGLERLLGKYFRDRFSQRESKRCEILGQPAEILSEELVSRLTGYADCFFVMQQMEEKDKIFLVQSIDMESFVMEILNKQDVASAVFGNGSVTFSADSSASDNNGAIGFYFIGYGDFAEQIEKMSAKFGGSIY